MGSASKTGSGSARLATRRSATAASPHRGLPAEQVQEHSDGMGAVRAAMDAEFGAAAAPGEDVDEQEPTLA